MTFPLCQEVDMKITKKRLKELIAEGKAKMENAVNDPLARFGRNHTAECMYCALDKDKKAHFIEEDNMACHAGVSTSFRHKNGENWDYYSCSGMEEAPFMIDNIMGKEYGTHEQRVRFLQYVMDHPIFGKSFVEHDAEKALKEKMMVRSLSTLPSNVTMLCLILTRALWEEYQGRVVKNFSDLINIGFTPDQALILAYFVRVGDDGLLKFSPQVDSGHSAFSTGAFSVKAFVNFINHKLINVSPGTIVEGYGTSNGLGSWCVDNVFIDIPDDYPLHSREYVKGDKRFSGWVKKNIDNLKDAVNKLTEN